MKAITITQPWASLIASGAKQVETRSWSTRYRGPLAIHAGAGLGPVSGRRGLVALLLTEPFRSVLAQAGIDDSRNLPLGCILAIGELVAVFPASAVDDRGVPLSARERAFGNFTTGRYGWRLENVHRLASPIPARGALGLWEWEPLGGWLAELQTCKPVPFGHKARQSHATGAGSAPRDIARVGDELGLKSVPKTHFCSVRPNTSGVDQQVLRNYMLRNYVTVPGRDTFWSGASTARSWTAALTGTMGERTEKDFALATPGLQVFERQPKAPVEAASPRADALSAALAAVSPVETAPAPAVANPAEMVSVPPARATAESDSASRKPVLSLKNRKATS